MFILKTKGTSNIPDFVQIRDDDFALIAHFKISEAPKKLKNLGFQNIDKILNFIENIDYEKIVKLEADGK